MTDGSTEGPTTVNEGERTNLRSLDLQGLASFVATMGWEPYRSRQLFTWIWQKGVSEIDRMTNLSKASRAELQKRAYVGTLRETNRLTDADGTVKFGFALEDGLEIESVYVPDPPRRTVCVSTQVGCAMGCRLCFTGRMGFKRNLAFHEIADQVLQIGLLLNLTVTNVVMMGMGEPMLNLDEVLKASEVLNSDLGLKIGARHITISTAGIPDGIRLLADYPKQLKLAVSLNAADSKTRDQLMPINRKYPLEELFRTVRYYVERTKRRVTFEYVLVRETNDRERDARLLVSLLRGLPCKVNLIPLNECPDGRFESPSPASVERFARFLYPHLPAVTIRKSMGRGIMAACGQLAGEPNRRR